MVSSEPLGGADGRPADGRQTDVLAVSGPCGPPTGPLGGLCGAVRRAVRSRLAGRAEPLGEGAGSDIDKSLGLEKFSKRNDSDFSLSLARSYFSCLVLLSIFKNRRNSFSFYSRFSRFEKKFSFSSRFSRFFRPISLSPLDFQDFRENFSVSSRFSRFS